MVASDIVIGERLRQVRQSSGMYANISLLARDTGVTRSQIHQLERGKHALTMTTLRKLAEKLPLNMCQLLEADET
jgi:transcriptional regulator with XRE-family HTH domain